MLGCSRCIVDGDFSYFYVLQSLLHTGDAVCLFYAWCMVSSGVTKPQSKSRGQSGLVLVVVHATKETCVLSFAAMVAVGE